MKRFHHHNSLRIFALAAQQDSLSAAAETLNVTKGAVSHQIRQLEDELGFAVFHRHARGIELTQKGRDLLTTVDAAFTGIEHKINVLRQTETHTITLGLSTYLASRWLSSRLMMFIEGHPEIRLRLQPMVDLSDLRSEDIDIAIRWGNGKWDDLVITPLFSCPAFPTGSPEVHRQIEKQGMAAVLASRTLLRDRDGSTAWRDWHDAAGFTHDERAEMLTIPDPNVRVQAVVDGQGIALNDALVARELNDGRLMRLSETQMDDYGYFLVHAPDAMDNPDIAAFAIWLTQQAAAFSSDDLLTL